MKVSKLTIFRTSAIIQLSIINLILTPSICHSRSIIVDASGGGEFTRIGDAINIAYSGDLIIVKSGYYNEAITVNKNIELTGDGPQHTKITSSTDGIAVQNGVTAKITGFTITAAHNGILVSAYAKVDIRNNYIIGNGSCGIYSYNANNSITNVINNVIAYNGSSGIWFHMTSCLRNITINVISNIVVSNKNYGLYLSANDSCCYATLSHNDVYDNYPSNYREKEIGYGDISINPGFMDPGTGNLVLLSNSPCINAGRPSAADIDPDGTRNDMGAFGGPEAAAFWPYSEGSPIITNINVDPIVVSKGSPATINATAEVFE